MITWSAKRYELLTSVVKSACQKEGGRSQNLRDIDRKDADDVGHRALNEPQLMTKLIVTNTVFKIWVVSVIKPLYDSPKVNLRKNQKS